MGSRVGSILVFLALAVIVVVAVVLVLRFSGDSESDQPVMVISLVNDQPVLLGQPLAVDVRARSGEPISIFALLIDDMITNQAIAIDNADQGLYSATLFWTPTTLGFANLRVVATDTAGTQTELAVRVDVTDDAERVAQAAAARAGRQPQADAAEPPPPPTDNAGGGDAGQPAQGAPTDQEQQAAGNGVARILSPEEGARYELGLENPLNVTIETSNTGLLSSVLFYVTPVLANGSFGRSQLVYSANPDVSATGGSYRTMVSGTAEWFPRAGAYELELVALTLEQVRFEHRVRITVIGDFADDQAAEDVEDEAESDDEPDQQSTQDAGALPDLAILTVRQDDAGIAVTIINNGEAAANRTPVEISLIRARDASLLASANALVTLEPEQRVSIPLEVAFDDPTNAFVVLVLDADADATNNTFEVDLAASEAIAGGAGTGDEADDELDSDEPPEEDDDLQQVSPPSPPAEQADLAFLEVLFTDDGYALLTVINAGEAPASDFTIQIATEDGQVLETITRGDGAAPLVSRDSEILAGNISHSGTVLITLDPDNTTAESNEDNNQIRLEVGG